MPSVSASEARNGQRHVTKHCPSYTGAAGDYCTIKTSNLAEIQPGSNVYYDEAAGIPAGFLDSNIVLNVGTGDWAVGRCKLDSTNSGLCTFSDGRGPLAGFTARVKVSPLEALCMTGTGRTASIRCLIGKTSQGIGMRYRFRCVVWRSKA